MNEASAPVAEPLFDRGVLRRLPAALRHPTSAFRSIAVGWATSFIPSIFLSLAATSLLPGLPGPEFGQAGSVLLVLLVIFSPLIETLIMAVVLELLRRVMFPTAAVIVSALGWAAAHSLATPVWGLVIWWPFIIFSMLYLAWRSRGVMPAIGVAAATHACQNLPVALLML